MPSTGGSVPPIGIAPLSTVKAITTKRSTMPLSTCPAGGLAPMSGAVAITAKSGLAFLPLFMHPLTPKRGVKSGILWMIGALTWYIGINITWIIAANPAMIRS
ncbi:hypothetical protein SP5_034_00140 [Sphingomonas parapaucimobilis NBRC 15100]|uniref:Uncharacterized protein n=1 Tax=Sphingomonas parapaucimobilis NBRC 15100 TaxID=1219049 RepID=A0A0A1W526_9SPHN|nr:hypothetical protein SP5_034_00140 [Sphingomonas parapaucimobilis NBRC 15100]